MTGIKTLNYLNIGICIYYQLLSKFPLGSYIMQNVEYIQLNNLSIDEGLFQFVNNSVLKQLELQPETFWAGFEKLLSKHIATNEALLVKRGTLQRKIDAYHQSNPTFEFSDYKQFLGDIGYLLPEPDKVSISPQNVDDELSQIAGPQLVVPVMNARYALNAVNARWGSLYDALYGTDVIPHDTGSEPGTHYNPIRGEQVIAYGRAFLNDILPISGASWEDVLGFDIELGQLKLKVAGQTAQLETPTLFAGYRGLPHAPTHLLFKHNNLHFYIEIDDTHVIGKTDLAHIKDIKVESAISTIMDCEDSVAAVDGEDKVQVYKNWLGLMQGDLSVEVNKGGTSTLREMNPDLNFVGNNGNSISLSGRSLMFVRNVGHLMTTPAVLYNQKEIPEGILDGVITSIIGKIDLAKPVDATIKNSKKGSIYIVKPKMHGPEEVAFANQLFDDIEDLIDVPRHTIKMGIMDEERRTSLNLKACIGEAAKRVVFINTGFLDRTGDEIHTSMLAGPFLPKAQIKTEPWLNAYEQSNVANGLATGFHHAAQIGKGMWPIPDHMQAMMVAKLAHPQAGATTAWVPSPTAATLHALHYHKVNVGTVQESLLTRCKSDIDQILEIPLLQDEEQLTQTEITAEIENNAQGILGYVVRWVDQGVGCSKVPDINNVGLMEDRATCRISSQHITNWLHHGLCDKQQIVDIFKKMAVIVDKQNHNDKNYVPMAPHFDSSIAFNAALNLVLEGTSQPSGYTEPLLHQARLAKKQEQNSPVQMVG